MVWVSGLGIQASWPFLHHQTVIIVAFVLPQQVCQSQKRDRLRVHFPPLSPLLCLEHHLLGGACSRSRLPVYTSSNFHCASAQLTWVACYSAPQHTPVGSAGPGTSCRVKSTTPSSSHVGPSDDGLGCFAVACDFALQGLDLLQGPNDHTGKQP